MFFVEKELCFDAEEKKMKRVKLDLSDGGHMMVNLRKAGEWELDETVYFLRKEEDVTTYSTVKKIHKILNHKKEDQMLCAYRIAGKLTQEAKEI